MYEKIEEEYKELPNILEVLALGKSNFFFDAFSKLKEVVETAKRIKDTDFGSWNNTKEMLAALEACQKSIKKFNEKFV